jgi:hypothetical protein
MNGVISEYQSRRNERRAVSLYNVSGQNNVARPGCSRLAQTKT